ncbi:Ig domain-containing protein [Plantibacter sp. T3]|uniref:Ig domain-containing protein n=1 Tax=Plantibacter sp. T3 TaxID=2653161 RepID=UPI0012F0E676|nr:Ig domain-containing protein [Plantibacter sp. T3]VXB44829.1 exported hypothetical protein [Plantibacter sp. T3]
MSHLPRRRRALAASALLGTAAIASSLIPTAAWAAAGDTNVVADPNFQACLNEDQFKRDAATPITEAELATVTGWVECVSKYATITSLEGAQFLVNAPILSLHSNLEINDLTPLEGMDALRTLTLQGYKNLPATIDLHDLAGVGDTLTSLSLIPAVADETVAPPTTITGWDALPNLTKLSVPFNRQTDMDLQALTALTDLRVGYNLLDGADLASFPRGPYNILNLEFNAINDFSGLPTTSTLWADDQRHVSSEPILKSAEQSSITATPADRTVPWSGGTARLGDGSVDAGPLTFASTDIVTRAQASAEGLEPVRGDYEWYAQYSWTIDDPSGAAANGTTLYPVVEVDQHDASVSVPAHTALDEELVTFDYSNGTVDAYAPTSYSTVAGSLPDGLSVDPQTGHLVGTTTTTGTFSVTIDTTDASGLTTRGEHTVTIDALVVPDPATPGVDNPAGPDNASWIVPADTDLITWTLRDGHLIATTVPGAVFADGTDTIDYGVAVDPDTQDSGDTGSGSTGGGSSTGGNSSNGKLASTGVDAAGTIAAIGGALTLLAAGLVMMLRRQKQAQR